MSHLPPVAQALAAHHIPFRLFEHPGPVHSLEQAAAERGQTPRQIVRSLLFRVDGEHYVMALVAGPAQIAWPALRRILNVSRVTTATQAQVLDVTGYAIGAVAPFGLSQPVRVLVDRSVLDQEELSMGSGIRGTALIIHREDLLNALKKEQGDVEIVTLSLAD